MFSLDVPSCVEMNQGATWLDLPNILYGSSGTQLWRLGGIWLGIQARPSSSSSVEALGCVAEDSPG